MPFSRGKSGNPSGRPKGIRDRRTSLRDLLEPHAPELVAKAVELALAGDSAALRMCLDRLIPPAKAKDEPVRLPAVAGSLADAGRSVLEALARGQIGPDDAGAVMSAIASQVRIVDAVEIETRLRALENRAHALELPAPTRGA